MIETRIGIADVSERRPYRLTKNAKLHAQVIDPIRGKPAYDFAILRIIVSARRERNRLNYNH